MISARRAALLGLDAPLSPIMAAVLGLWPEQDAVLPVAVATGYFQGGPDGPSTQGQRDEHDPLAEFIAKQAKEAARIHKQNQAAIALILAAITERILE